MSSVELPVEQGSDFPAKAKRKKERKNFKMLWQKSLRKEKLNPAHVIVIQEYYMI